MKVALDACVLYPTVLRRIVVGVCAAGLAAPVWSPRILAEWAGAAARLGPGHEASARAEIAALTAAWPDASVTPDAGVEATLRLPDPADVHVAAAAHAGGAAYVVTLNLRDFPARRLAPFGVAAVHPDPWLLAQHDRAPDAVAAVAETVRAEAERHAGCPQPMRALLKRARLPRLGKRLAAGGETLAPG